MESKLISEDLVSKAVSALTANPILTPQLAAMILLIDAIDRLRDDLLKLPEQDLTNGDLSYDHS